MKYRHVFRCLQVIMGCFGLLANVQGVRAEGFGDFIRKDQSDFQKWRQPRSGADDKEPPQVFFRQEQLSSVNVVYSGHAEADGRTASLTLTFVGNTVSGRMQAKGVSEDGIRLPSTDIAFSNAPLTGIWEDDKTTILASWTGGDYAVNGELMPYYPTSGALSIKRTYRGDNLVIYLSRLHNNGVWGYTFTPHNRVVYNPNQPTDAPEPSDESLESSDMDDVLAGYWDPVGIWKGSWSPFQDESQTAYTLILEKGYDAEMAIDDMEGTSGKLRGRWEPLSNSLRIEWIKVEGDEEQQVIVRFDGPDGLLVPTDEGHPIRLKRQAVASDDEDEDDDAKAPTVPPVDLETVSEITLSPSTLKVTPGTAVPLPRVIGKIKQTGEIIELRDLDVKWAAGMYLTPANGELEVSTNARIGQQGRISATASVGTRLLTAICEVSIVESFPTGVYEGRVSIKYRDPEDPKNTFPELPKRPLQATVVVNGPGSSHVKTVHGSERYRFEHLEKGNYNVSLRNVKLPPGIPDDFVYDVETENQGDGFYFPYSLKTNNPWRRVGNAIYKLIRRPDVAYCVYGKVRYKGKPVPEAEVTLTGHDGRSIGRDKTSSEGFYRIRTEALERGSYYLQVIKMVGKNQRWATDDDLMDIASSAEGAKPVAVSVPVSRIGLEINIPCLTRREIFGDTGVPAPDPSALEPLESRR